MNEINDFGKLGDGIVEDEPQVCGEKINVNGEIFTCHLPPHDDNRSHHARGTLKLVDQETLQQMEVSWEFNSILRCQGAIMVDGVETHCDRRINHTYKWGSDSEKERLHHVNVMGTEICWKD